MTDPKPWIAAARASHDRLTSLLVPLSTEQVTSQSYATEWTIADVASHLGSQAEIFELFLDAGLSGAETPGGEVFGPIWDRWNALVPIRQVSESIEANERFLRTVEQLPDDRADALRLSMFGRDVDLAGLVGLRLGEHALHTWDVAVALDPTATLSPDAVNLLVDGAGAVAERGGRPVDGGPTVLIATTEPDRLLRLHVDPAVALLVEDSGEPDVTLPAEALIRLVFGRLDAEHTPADITGAEHLDELRAAFPGF